MTQWQWWCPQILDFYSWFAGSSVCWKSPLAVLNCSMISADIESVETQSWCGRSRLLLQELCRAAVHFQRYDEDTLIRRVWQECLKLARFKSRRCVDVDDDSFTLACNEIQEVVSEGLCTESIAWRLASALAVFDERRMLPPLWSKRNARRLPRVSAYVRKDKAMKTFLEFVATKCWLLYYLFCWKMSWLKTSPFRTLILGFKLKDMVMQLHVFV